MRKFYLITGVSYLMRPKILAQAPLRRDYSDLGRSTQIPKFLFLEILAEAPLRKAFVKI